MSSKDVERETVLNPKESSSSLSTCKVEKPTVRTRLKIAANWIAEHELWLLAVPVTLMLFYGRVPLRIISASLLLIPIPWVCRLLARGYLTVHTSMDLPILALFGMALVGLYPSVDPSMSVPVLYKMIVEFALFYGLINNSTTGKRIWVITSLFFAGGVGASLLGLVNTSWIANKLFSMPQIYGRLPRLLTQLNRAGFHPNIVGGTLGMILPVALSVLLFSTKATGSPTRVGGTDAKQQPHFSIMGIAAHSALGISYRTWKGLLTLTLLIMGSTLFLTQSRGTFVGLLFACAVMALWRGGSLRLVVLLVAIGIILAIHFLGLEQIADFVFVADSVGTMRGRVELWQRAIYMMQDFPYTGIGLGTFSRVAPILYPFFLIGPDTMVPHCHNLFLQTGVDLGIPGLVALIALLVAFSFIAVKAVRLSKGTAFEPLAVGLLCGFVVYPIHGLLDNVTFSTKPGMAIWAIMGLLVALYRQHHPTRFAG